MKTMQLIYRLVEGARQSKVESRRGWVWKEGDRRGEVQKDGIWDRWTRVRIRCVASMIRHTKVLVIWIDEGV